MAAAIVPRARPLRLGTVRSRKDLDSYLGARELPFEIRSRRSDRSNRFLTWRSPRHWSVMRMHCWGRQP